MQRNDVGGQVSLFGPDMEYGRTCPELSPADGTPSPEKRGRERTSKSSSSPSSKLKNHTFMLLDLRPGAGNMLGPCWEYDPVWLGSLGTLNTSECPSDVVESSLSQILLDTVPSKYYSSQTACRGMLRRAEERGKELPQKLKAALMVQAGICSIDEFSGLFAETNDTPPDDQDLGDTKFAAGFSAGAGSSAGSIAYSEQIAPTLKGSASGNCMPSVLCLNDQGGSIMECSENISGTLRAQEHGHQPLVFDNHGQDTRFCGPVDCAQTISASFGEGGNNQPLVYENHGIDARYTGPHPVVPTLSARAGTGGNNLPLVEQEPAETFCITGNAIDRQPQNGGNGIGYQEDVSYTLTATDHHAVFSRQRADKFSPSDVASTESARQYKDATDLIHQAAGTGPPQLIRRLTPLECERLQGFPDGWTDLPGASDSARYRALGNSVAIPCVEFIMRGVIIAAGYSA